VTTLSSPLWLLAPEITLAAGALLLLMLGVIRPLPERDAPGITWLAIAILVGAGVLLAAQPTSSAPLFGGSLQADAFARFMKLLTLAASAASLLLALEFKP
jgi:NADH-quinone oxidoreductase subunit N